MTKWQSLAEDLGEDDALVDLTDDQVEAMVDVLALIIHADETVAPIEVAGFNHLVFNMPWTKGRRERLEDAVKGAASRAREAGADEEARQEIAHAASPRLGGAPVRERVFRMAATLAGVDLEVNAAEVRALSWLAEALEIDADSARSIVERAEGGETRRE